MQEFIVIILYLRPMEIYDKIQYFCFGREKKSFRSLTSGNGIYNRCNYTFVCLCTSM